MGTMHAEVASQIRNSRPSPLVIELLSLRKEVSGKRHTKPFFSTHCSSLSLPSSSRRPLVKSGIFKYRLGTLSA